MSIERFDGLYYVLCDICGDELPTEFDFYDAIEAKKRAGWRSQINEHDDWVDVCPSCQRADMEDAFAT